MPESHEKLRDAHQNEHRVDVTTKDGSLYPHCIVEKAKNVVETGEAEFILNGGFGRKLVRESDLEEVTVQDA